MKTLVCPAMLTLFFLLFTGCGESSTPDKKNPLDKNAQRIDTVEAEKLKTEELNKIFQTQKALALTQTYKHTTGAYFLYPENWKVQEGQGFKSQSFLYLVPNDLIKHKGKPAELISLSGEEAGGITDPASTKVVDFVKKYIGVVFSYLSLKDTKTSTINGKKYCTLLFKGKNPVTKKNDTAKVWLIILNDYCVCFFVLAPDENFPDREKICENIFATFGIKKPKTDPRLIGNWRYTKVYTSNTPSRSFSYVSDRYMTLKADGSCIESGQSGASTDRMSTGISKGKTYYGTWSTQGKNIFLRWKNGTPETWSFIISGNDMLFKYGKTKKLWKRYY